MNKRNFIAALLLGASSLGASAQAPAYPVKPIRLLVGFAPGGAADYVARAMSDAMGKALGQSVIVENKPGAGSSIAADMVAKSPPDGYTLLVASPSSISVNPALNPKLSYTARDLAPITKLTSSPLVIAANPATGINSIQDLVARAKKAPGTLNYATSGNGSAPHLGATLFSQVAGGIEFWYGLFVPAGTPPAVIKKIFEAATASMEQPQVKAALAREGTEVDLSRTSDDFGAVLEHDAKLWGKLVKDAGVKLD